jgi:hypothetical protein
MLRSPTAPHALPRKRKAIAVNTNTGLNQMALGRGPSRTRRATTEGHPHLRTDQTPSLV